MTHSQIPVRVLPGSRHRHAGFCIDFLAGNLAFDSLNGVLIRGIGYLSE